MKLLVIGYARHGKDTVCELLCEHGGLSFASSSEFVGRKAVLPALSSKYGYETYQQCYEDRVNHRSEWYDLIREYNKDDGARVARELLSEYDIYCGMRAEEELAASRHLFDLIIWVDASTRIGKDESSASCTVSRSDADIIIENNAGLADLDRKVKRLLHALKTSSSSGQG